MIRHRVRALLALLSLSCYGMATAAEGTVIINGENCDYLLVDSSQGSVLLKLVKGDVPKRGDRLIGDLKQSDFSKLTNRRTGGELQVWVDLVDRSTSKALMRFGQYCP